MDLIIKGMSLPEECSECLFSCYDVSVCAPAECIILGERVARYSRLKNCPLVALPTPHGRLIDADKAATSIMMMNNHPCGNSIENVNDVVEWLRFVDENGNNIAFPTIIETEVNE